MSRHSLHLFGTSGSHSLHSRLLHTSPSLLQLLHLGSFRQDSHRAVLQRFRTLQFVQRRRVSTGGSHLLHIGLCAFVGSKHDTQILFRPSNLVLHVEPITRTLSMLGQYTW